MKKWLVWDAMVRQPVRTEVYFKIDVIKVRARNRAGSLGIIVNDVDPDRNVPAGYEEWAEAMNKDQECPWTVATYNKVSRVWEWPPAHYPRSRGPQEITVDVPTDAEIKNLMHVLDTFKDRFGNFSIEVLERHKTAFQELMLAEKTPSRRGSPYSRGSRPHSRVGSFVPSPSPRAGTPMTPLSGGMLGLQM
ncbi:hypothetical protein H0H92_002295 [Tricholoma furcatifolium]|nr:hypothetical protein H0H92_002295 [Tricholoma furcatifolium]